MACTKAVDKVLTSFGPVAHISSQMLILGSMPGVKSLGAGQYYAHRQNAFWEIMGAIIGFNPTMPYAEREQKLTSAGIALWDVVQSCEREGSLDAAIKLNTIKPNDFLTFYIQYPNIKWVYFNGAMAERCYKTLVMPALKNSLIYARLPSTSPAHATLTFQTKVNAWRMALENN